MCSKSISIRHIALQFSPKQTHLTKTQSTWLQDYFTQLSIPAVILSCFGFLLKKEEGCLFMKVTLIPIDIINTIIWQPLKPGVFFARVSRAISW
jgi:hypothetical protein